MESGAYEKMAKNAIEKSFKAGEGLKNVDITYSEVAALQNLVDQDFKIKVMK